jgi:AcrR family transcriptional regulator
MGAALAEPDAPRGRDAVMAALIDAAAELFAEQPPAAVSVRAVAERAGVNHGLVHRHFGSKQDLERAVLEHLAGRIQRSATRARQQGPAGASDLGSALLSALRATLDEPRYVRALARALLDGREPTALQRRFPMLQELIEATREAQRKGQLDGDLDPRMLVAAVAAMGLGWALFEPYLLAATEQGRTRPATVRRRLLDTLARLAPLKG